MITFKDFITESRKFNLEQFKKDCSFMLHQLEGTNGKLLMYRGYYNVPTDSAGWTIETWTQRSEPRDTKKKVHDATNEHFMNTFGIPGRNWVFGTSDIQDAGMYSSASKVAAIFPIGKFQWLNSPNIMDYTSWVMLERQKIQKDNPDLPYDEVYEQLLDDLPTLLDKVVWNFNEHFVESLKSRCEIMFKCEKYYAFNVHGSVFKDKILPFLSTL